MFLKIMLGILVAILIIPIITNKIWKYYLPSTITVFVIYQILFILFHPLIGIITTILTILTVLIVYLCAEKDDFTIHPFIMYVFLFATSFSLLFEGVETIFGRLF